MVHYNRTKHLSKYSPNAKTTGTKN